jgi:ketosteroid isomerase-like protein
MPSSTDATRTAHGTQHGGRHSALSVVRACFQAYVDKDRAAMERLLDAEYHFTSPLDNALDRATYFEVCWPNSGMMTRFDRILEIEDGDRAFVVYEAATSTGKRFRNSEVHTVRDGKLVATEVYFGWDLPHAVPRGTHVTNQGHHDLNRPA